MLHQIDIFVILFYLVLCLFIGLYKAKAITTLKQFSIGAGNASSPLLVAVIFATAIGAGSTFGVVGKIYLLGLVFVLRQLVQPLFWLIATKIFANNIEKFHGCLTVSHVMYKLYGTPGRWMTSILSLMISAGIIAVQATSIGYVCRYFFNIDIIYGIFITYGILTIYSASGGIRAVVFTEVFQFAVFFVIIPVSCAIFFAKTGSIESLMLALPKTHTTLEISGYDTLMMVGLFLYVLIPACDGPIVQRFLMASSSAELKKALKQVFLISIPFALILCFIAYLIRAASPNLEPTEALLYFTSQLPAGFKGLMITGLLAIAMSTAEAWINSAAIITVNDIVKPLFPHIGTKKQLLFVRFSTIAISFASVFIAIFGKGIIELTWLLRSFWDPVILIPLSAGFLGFKTNSKSFIANVAVALLFCLIGGMIAGGFGSLSLCTGLIGSVIGFFGMHYWQVYNGTLNQPLPRLAIRLPKIANPFNNFPAKVKAFRERVWLEKPRVGVFGHFVLNYYFFFCLSLSNTPTHQLLIALMVLGFLLSGPLLMRDVFFSQKLQKKYFAFYWYGLITYCLPLIGSYCLLASNGSVLQTITGIVFTTAVFYFLPVISSLVIITIGSLLGYAVFALSHMHFGMAPVIPVATIAYIYSLILIISALFLRYKENAQQEKIEAMQAIAGTIAHEVRSPISSMSMMMETLADILGDAMKTGKQKKDELILRFSKLDYEMVLTIYNNCKKQGIKSIHTIESILLLLKTSLDDCKKKKIQISELIKLALDEYKNHNPAVENIEVKIDQDFELECHPLYLSHVLYNLLKNSYKYNGNNVKIDIGVKNRTLYFTDYGNGISEEVLPYIFDRFYTKGTGGTGLGLSFCKLVMESLRGTISCQSKVGKYTRFKLAFGGGAEEQV